MRRPCLALAGALGWLALAPAPAGADLGVVGCVAQPPGAPRACTAGHGLLDASAVALTPGDGPVLVTGEASSALAAINRAPGGGLAFGSCLSDDGTDGLFGQDGACGDGDALGSPASVAVAADGRAYVAARSSRGIALVTTGAAALMPAGCLADRGAGRCSDVEALGAPSALAFSPDGHQLYTAAADLDGVGVFSVDAGTGGLSRRSCVSDNGTDGVCADGPPLRGPEAVAVSPDGAFVYVAAARSGAISSFRRDGSTGDLTATGCVLADAPPGPCARAAGLSDVNDLAFNADGSRLYATSGSGTLTVFARDPAGGGLQPLACLAADPFSNPGCRQLAELEGASGVAVGADGTVFVAAAESSTVLEIAVDPATGRLSRRSCVAAFEIEGCARSAAVEGAADVALGPDGRVYVAASEANALTALAPAPALAVTSAPVRGGIAGVSIRCPAAAPRACAGRVVLERAAARRRVIGTARFHVRRGNVRRVPIRLRGARHIGRVSASLRDRHTSGRRSALRLGKVKAR